MTIKVYEENGKQVIAPEGKIDHVTVEAFEAKITELCSANDNFAEMVFPYAEDFETFCQTARQVKALAASTDPYELADAMTDYNVVLVSALPKLDFTSFCNTQRDRRGNDYPLFVIGKMGDDKTMPISVTAHHGFVDGEHISRFFDLPQKKLDQL